VDDNGFHPGLPEGPHGMDGAIVELDALADADGPRPQHDDFAASPDGSLIETFISGVVIGRSTPAANGLSILTLHPRVDASIAGHDAVGLAAVANFLFGCPHQLTDDAVGKPVLLGFPE